MKLFFTTLILTYSTLSMAVNFKDVKKGDLLEFNYSCKVKEQLGRKSLFINAGTQVIVKNVQKQITSPAGFLPAIQSHFIKFRYQFTTRFGNQKTYIFELRSESDGFYCVDKVL